MYFLFMFITNAYFAADCALLLAGVPPLAVDFVVVNVNVGGCECVCD